MESFAIDVVLELPGLRCPMPLLKTKQALSSMDAGHILKVVATDVGSWRDIPAFISLSKHVLIKQEKTEIHYIFIIKKGE